MGSNLLVKTIDMYLKFAKHNLPCFTAIALSCGTPSNSNSASKSPELNASLSLRFAVSMISGLGRWHACREDSEAPLGGSLVVSIMIVASKIAGTATMTNGHRQPVWGPAESESTYRLFFRVLGLLYAQGRVNSGATKYESLH